MAEPSADNREVLGPIPSRRTSRIAGSGRRAGLISLLRHGSISGSRYHSTHRWSTLAKTPQSQRGDSGFDSRTVHQPRSAMQSVERSAFQAEPNGSKSRALHQPLPGLQWAHAPCRCKATFLFRPYSSVGQSAPMVRVRSHVQFVFRAPACRGSSEAEQRFCKARAEISKFSPGTTLRRDHGMRGVSRGPAARARDDLEMRPDG